MVWRAVQGRHYTVFLVTPFYISFRFFFCLEFDFSPRQPSSLFVVRYVKDSNCFSLANCISDRGNERRRYYLFAFNIRSFAHSIHASPFSPARSPIHPKKPFYDNLFLDDIKDSRFRIDAKRFATRAPRIHETGGGGLGVG